MSSLRVSETKIPGCWVVETSLFEDMRGTFVEGWNAEAFADVGLPLHWPQDNISISHANVVRGLHIQRNYPQGKLVRCVEGAVLDLCLDLRKESKTLGQWVLQRLDGGTALYCPPGTAHGFLALEPRSVVYYKCTTLYDRDSDGGVNWMDNELDIHWWKNHKHPVIMSDKDKNLPSLREWLADPRGVVHVQRD
jgi:dTDP-4-dehydrorhamnose 3,5-epimerase